MPKISDLSKITTSEIAERRAIITDRDLGGQVHEARRKLAMMEAAAALADASRCADQVASQPNLIFGARCILAAEALLSHLP